MFADRPHHGTYAAIRDLVTVGFPLFRSELPIRAKKISPASAEAPSMANEKILDLLSRQILCLRIMGHHEQGSQGRGESDRPVQNQASQRLRRL